MSCRENAGLGSCLDNEWPERLRRGVWSVLRRCEISRSEWIERGFDVHHIVAAGLDGAAPGRRLLTRWSVSVHSVLNAAIIPRSFHQGQGLHRQEFLQLINQRIAAADMFAEALAQHGGPGAGRLIMVQTIQKIGSELVLRSGDGVAIRLQSTLHDMLTRPAASGGGGGRLRSDGGAHAAARSVRERGRAPEERADRGDATLPGPRRFSFHFAAACP